MPINGDSKSVNCNYIIIIIVTNVNCLHEIAEHWQKPFR